MHGAALVSAASAMCRVGLGNGNMALRRPAIFVTLVIIMSLMACAAYIITPYARYLAIISAAAGENHRGGVSAVNRRQRGEA